MKGPVTLVHWFKGIHAQAREQNNDHPNLRTESYRGVLLHRLTHFKPQSKFYSMHMFSSFIKYFLNITDTEVQHPTVSTALRGTSILVITKKINIIFLMAKYITFRIGQAYSDTQKTGGGASQVSTW